MSPVANQLSSCNPLPFSGQYPNIVWGPLTQISPSLPKGASSPVFGSISLTSVSGIGTPTLLFTSAIKRVTLDKAERFMCVQGLHSVIP